LDKINSFSLIVTLIYYRVPPNLRFQIDDAESEWTFPLNEPFDYIRLRSMGGSIADWPRLFKQAYDHLSPGGWIEVTDSEAWASTDDNSLPETSSYAELQRRLDEASTKFGRKMNIAPHHKQALISAGFEDVVDEVRKVSRITPI
jgi:SAM-dependent methyltransferase